MVCTDTTKDITIDSQNLQSVGMFNSIKPCQSMTCVYNIMLVCVYMCGHRMAEREIERERGRERERERDYIELGKIEHSFG